MTAPQLQHHFTKGKGAGPAALHTEALERNLVSHGSAGQEVRGSGGQEAVEDGGDLPRPVHHLEAMTGTGLLCTEAIEAAAEPVAAHISYCMAERDPQDHINQTRLLEMMLGLVVYYLWARVVQHVQPTGARRKSGRFQSPPRPCRLLVAAGAEEQPVLSWFSRLSWLAGSGAAAVESATKYAELCSQLLGRHAQVGAAGRRSGGRCNGRSSAALSGTEGRALEERGAPAPCALSSRSILLCSPLLLLLSHPHTGRTQYSEGHVELRVGLRGLPCGVYRALRAPCPAVSSLLLGRDLSASASPRLRLSAAG
ncbi:unnamed protein product [Pleuronectes platessa]|uniref:Uncharacterized protein n=1 Tax=Pleuronectes platessa TaxID=8262 RepID=A0A9N7UX54_PLEPL|nr:unnamed protein product [Pleuronectes platessa]